MMYSKSISRFLSCRVYRHLASSLKARRISSSSSPSKQEQVKEVIGEDLQMPPCDYHPGTFKGMPLEDVKRVRKSKLSPGLVTSYKTPLYLWKGHEQWLWDTDNRRYLDFLAGMATVSCGHSHPHVTKAAKDQLDKLWHVTNIYYNSPIHEYADMLTEKFPGNLKVCHFVNSGSEANDMAVMMARIHTGNYDVVSLRNSYHGSSMTTLGMLNHSMCKPNTPVSFGHHATMNPDVYRGLWGGAHCRNSIAQTQRSCSCSPGNCEASDKYADQLQDLLVHCTGKRVAAFFAEPIQGFGGTVQLPKGYLKKAYKLIRDNGGLCISDEVQCGFGRLGSHYWGFQLHDVVPDIVTMAKSIGNGFPMAAVVTTPEISASFALHTHFNTYGGNPVACAVGKAVLETIDKEHLQENSAKVGTYLLEKLLDLQMKFPDIAGDVRGQGLLIGMELVADKESKTPLQNDQMLSILEDCKDMGLLLGKTGHYGNVLRIKPPLCITKEDVDFGINVIKTALQRHFAHQS